MPKDDELAPGIAALRAMSATYGLVMAGLLVGLAWWAFSDGHDWTFWPLLGVSVLVALLADLVVQRRRARHFTLGIAVADTVLVASAIGAGLLLAAGSWLMLAGAAAVVVVQLAWLLRARALADHWDAPLVLALLLGGVAYVSGQRPWSPSSGQWPLVTGMAAVGALLGVVATLQVLPRRRRESGAVHL